MDKIAIILITKNRTKLLEQTIDSLVKSTPKDLYDLIVVDDGSDNIEHLKTYLLNDIISDLVITNFGSPSKCRNIGAEIARKKGYKFLYHTDNDMYFLPGWLEECHKNYNLNDNHIYFVPKNSKTDRIVIIGAYCHPFLQNNSDKAFSLDEIMVETVDAVSGNSWFISTEDYFSYGLHETDGIMASEDWEMCQRIRKDGHLVVRLVPHLVLHCGVTNSRGEASVGADVMLEELSQAQIKHNIKVYYE